MKNDETRRVRSRSELQMTLNKTKMKIEINTRENIKLEGFQDPSCDFLFIIIEIWNNGKTKDQKTTLDS